MSDERIDIEVSDKVDASIEKKLRDIAVQARDGHEAITKLKTAMSGLNSSAVSKLASDSSRLSTALLKEAQANAKLQQAMDSQSISASKAGAAKARLAVEAAKAAVAEERLAGEAAKTAAAQSRAATAQANAEAATLRLAAAQERAARAAQNAANAASDMERRVARLKGSVDPLNSSLDRQIAELREAYALYKAGGLSAEQFANYQSVLNGRIVGTTAAINAQNVALAKGVVSSKHMTQASLNLSRQFADIGVTAAMGMNPLMILIQQGPQVADAFQTAATQGLSAKQVLANFAGQAGRLAILLAPLVVVIGAVAAGFGLMHRELSKTYPKNITDGMKLTEEQLKRVESKTVTFGDTVAATFQIMGEDIMNSPVGDAIRWVGKTFDQVMDWITEKGSQTSAVVKGVLIGTFKFIMANWRRFPAAFGDLFVTAANNAIDAIEKLVNEGVDRINAFISGVNKVPGIELPTLNRASMGRIRNNFQGAGKDLAVDYVQATVGEIGAQYKAEEDRLARIGAAALARARKRALGEAGDPNATPRGRTGRQGAEDWDRAGELQNVNRELDNELSRLSLLKDAREVQQRMDQIEQKFAEKQVPLTQAESAALREKIQLIQHQSKVSSEADRIMEELNGPQEKYNTIVEAADALVSRAAISQEQYNRTVAAAQYAFAQATDPLMKYNQELDKQLQLLNYYGPAYERMAYMQQVEEDLKARGIAMTVASTGALTTEAAALMAKFDQLQRGKLIHEELNAIYQDITAQDTYLSNMQAMYDAIAKMRADNILSEQQAQRAIATVQNKYNEMRLQNTRNFFGTLAGLSSSGNKKIAMIGKAAAIAQATIDGYLAVQKAYTTMPYPFNIAAAVAQAALSASQIAGIMSTNVGSFQHGGSFIVQGQDGVDKNNINMNVSKGERVTIETQAQQRKGGGGANIEIHNYARGVTVEQEGTSDGKVRLIVREEMREMLPKMNEEQFSDPNSRTSKAAGRAFGLTRNRG